MDIFLKKHFKINNISNLIFIDIMLLIVNNVNRIGWIRNSDGSWSKDPQAEFDSDDNW